MSLIVGVFFSLVDGFSTLMGQLHCAGSQVNRAVSD
jgi:hypothetical protein